MPFCYLRGGWQQVPNQPLSFSRSQIQILALLEDAALIPSAWNFQDEAQMLAGHRWSPGSGSYWLTYPIFYSFHTPTRASVQGNRTPVVL